MNNIHEEHANAHETFQKRIKHFHANDRTSKHV